MQAVSTQQNIPKNPLQLGDTGPAVAAIHLTPRLPAPPSPPPRVSPPPQSTFVRPEPVVRPEVDSESSSASTPPEEAPELPEQQNSPAEQPAVTDDGSSLRIRLPGRYHPRDPSSARNEEEPYVPREVSRLLDPEHFQTGRPPPDLPRTRSGREHAQAALWTEYNSGDEEWAMSNEPNNGQITPGVGSSRAIGGITPPFSRIWAELPTSPYPAYVVDPPPFHTNIKIVNKCN
ncbi:hypothetical protein FRC20_005671 [Serendipita sp. 405]|nr:hypothetical protein FRC20_005671 [Serendipita sp. 405]